MSTGILPAQTYEIAFKLMGDERGLLVALEGEKTVPFPIKRTYYIFETVAGVTRGQHAHKTLQQVLVCVAGACTVRLTDGRTEAHVRLRRPDQGLYVGPSVWHDMYDFSDDCVLLVLASEHYDESDYLRDYDAFLAHVRAQPANP